MILKWCYDEKQKIWYFINFVKNCNIFIVTLTCSIHQSVHRRAVGLKAPAQRTLVIRSGLSKSEDIRQFVSRKASHYQGEHCSNQNLQNDWLSQLSLSYLLMINKLHSLSNLACLSKGSLRLDDDNIKIQCITLGKP